MNNQLLRKFLEARTLMDSRAEMADAPKKSSKETTTVDATPGVEGGVGAIIASKPPKKAVMKFLQEEINRLMDEDSD
jgi:hypothetical protein